MAGADDVELLDRVRAELAPRSDWKLAIVFGSKAKGRAGPNSDLDRRRGMVCGELTRP